MDFFAVDKETLVVKITEDEAAEILVKNGARRFRKEEIQEILVPEILRLEAEKFDFQPIGYGVHVDVSADEDYGLVLRIHGLNIPNFEEGDGEMMLIADDEPIPDDFLKNSSEEESISSDDEGPVNEEDAIQAQSIRWNSLSYKWLPVPFERMEDVIRFCRHLPVDFISESVLYRMEDRYYLLLKFRPVSEERGEAQYADFRKMTAVISVIEEYVTLPFHEQVSLGLLAEHGWRILKKDAVRFLAEIDRAA